VTDRDRARGLPSFYCSLENGDLPGVIQVVLSEANELRVRRIWRFCDQGLVETLGIEATNGVANPDV
jgi:hypothetical protein